ncbi:MAG: alpha-amylase family glycosyl hydrolase [Desulfobacteraceae bacterium]|nr:alpha-amylase family glycosyl hydrolase [Desulfobacteraceae bacterium]
MQSILNRIYGPLRGAEALGRISALMEGFSINAPPAQDKFFTETDAILISYGDTLLSPGQPPLQTLRGFAEKYFKDIFSTLHILPFFPFSSDDGFSVTDFFAVRSDLGSWPDIAALARDFKLMVDLVANHISAQSQWFADYLEEKHGFRELAIEVDPSEDLSSVTRPRPWPLLTPYDKPSGRRVHLWTTFSADQIDLNYRSLDVLEHMVRVLLFYVAHGAGLIRLDAIAYLWKQIGTACIHLPQTHDMVRLFRKILDHLAPHVMLVTETNVPHPENISYFGDGQDEAQMVYNFTLGPLLLHALTTGSTSELRQWAGSLKPMSTRTTFMNFTASHDGIGVRPLEGILSASQIQSLVDRAKQNGGAVSEKQNSDGSTSPYELNITYLDALKDPNESEDPFHIQRFLISQAAALALPGVPAVYIHSLLGSRNWAEGVRQTGRARTINRQQMDANEIGQQLEEEQTFRSQIFYPYLEMLRVRGRQPAFHPLAAMQVLHLDDRVLAIKRHCPRQTIFALFNFSADQLSLTLPGTEEKMVWTDLLSGRSFNPPPAVELKAYQILWLA